VQNNFSSASLLPIWPRIHICLVSACAFKALNSSLTKPQPSVGCRVTCRIAGSRFKSEIFSEVGGNIGADGQQRRTIPAVLEHRAVSFTNGDGDAGECMSPTAGLPAISLGREQDAVVI
jgi:hypothetical protein